MQSFNGLSALMSLEIAGNPVRSTADVSVSLPASIKEFSAWLEPQEGRTLSFIGMSHLELAMSGK